MKWSSSCHSHLTCAVIDSTGLALCQISVAASSIITEVLCPGSVLPPRQLPAHALVERQLLAHASRITCIRAQESCNMCATLDALGAVLIWQLQPLQPLQHIVSR